MVKTWGSRDPFFVAECLKIPVISACMGDEVRGFFVNHENHPVIVINSFLDDQTKRAVCAHELGHALLHPELDIAFLSSLIVDSSGKFERQAWVFASELLIPDEIPEEFAGLSRQQFASLIDCPLFLLDYKTWPTTDGPIFY